MAGSAAEIRPGEMLVGRTFQASRGGMPARMYDKNTVVNALQKGRKGGRCCKNQGGKKYRKQEKAEAGKVKKQGGGKKWEEEKTRQG